MGALLAGKRRQRKSQADQGVAADCRLHSHAMMPRGLLVGGGELARYAQITRGVRHHVVGQCDDTQGVDLA